MSLIGLKGKLAHGSVNSEGERLRNRVKTIKLRGNLSQGLVCKPIDLVNGKLFVPAESIYICEQEVDS